MRYLTILPDWTVRAGKIPGGEYIDLETMQCSDGALDSLRWIPMLKSSGGVLICDDEYGNIFTGCCFDMNGHDQRMMIDQGHCHLCIDNHSQYYNKGEWNKIQ